MFIVGDPSLRYGEIVAVIDAAKGAGVEKVGIVTMGMRNEAAGTAAPAKTGGVAIAVSDGRLEESIGLSEAGFPSGSRPFHFRLPPHALRDDPDLVDAGALRRVDRLDDASVGQAAVAHHEERLVGRSR